MTAGVFDVDFAAEHRRDQRPVLFKQQGCNMGQEEDHEKHAGACVDESRPLQKYRIEYDSS